MYAPESGSISVYSNSTSGYGKSIIWTAANGSESLHAAHMDEIVRTGPVNGGELIGFAGSTGDVQGSADNGGAHIHSARRANGAPAQLVLSGQAIVAGQCYVSAGQVGPPIPPPAPTSNGGSRIRGIGSERCIDVAGVGTANGTGVQLYDCIDGPNQHWVYSDGRVRVYGNYGKCLDADSTASGANGSRIQIWDCNGGPNQQWTANADGSLRSAASGRCLDAVGVGTTNGTKLQLWDCLNASNQKWQGIPAPNGGNPIRGSGSGRCLDVIGRGISPGTRVQIWDCTGVPQQQWKVQGSELRVYADKCLDAVDGGTANGTPIQIWYCNGSPQQSWSWREDGTIRSSPSGRCLDVISAGTANGSGLQLWDCHGGANQAFPRPRTTGGGGVPPANGNPPPQNGASGTDPETTKARSSGLKIRLTRRPGHRLRIVALVNSAARGTIRIKIRRRGRRTQIGSTSQHRLTINLRGRGRVKINASFNAKARWKSTRLRTRTITIR